MLGIHDRKMFNIQLISNNEIAKSLNIFLSAVNLGLRMVCFAVHQLHLILFVGICQFKGHDYLCR